MLLKLAVILSIPVFTAALPKVARTQNYPDCPVANAVLTFPEGQTALSLPSGQVPNQILLGVGVQNYTCTDAGTYTFDGVLADLSDISCLYGTPEFDTIQDKALAGQVQQSTKVIDLYFIANKAGGISEKFASAKDGGASFVVVEKVAALPAPCTAEDVDWVQLTKVEGDLAKTAFRVRTKGGQPPAYCTPGSPLISVPYAAQYWLFA